MRLFQLIAVVLLAAGLAAAAKEETKSREKRQQIAFYPRRGPRPPPYAVQMEPIVQYSQRDPLYNPLVSAKSDDGLYGESPLNYYPNDPEPIIEIIIKESNESLPTPVPPPPPAQPRPTKEPIQVFYVKYEKKKGHGESKARVVYDAPVPALTPVEEHEDAQPDQPAEYEQPVPPAVPEQPEPSTTLRTVIRPDSEVYHAGSSGIRVSFGTEQLPPNQHKKRSDQDAPPFSPAIAPAGSSGRQHGPYQPLQPVQQRLPPARLQQRVLNSFPQRQPQNFPPQQQLTGFPPQQQYQTPPQIRSQQQRPQRLPITIQGLPEVQQRTTFNSFGPPHRVNINHPQQPGFPNTVSVSHQSVNLQNQAQPPQHSHNFNADQQQHQQVYKQQEQEKQRYLEQRRHQELLRQQEQQKQEEQKRQQQLQQQQKEQQRQQDQQRLLEQQRQAEQRRLLEQQRLQQLEQQRNKQELEYKQLQQFQQQQQQQQQLKYSQAPPQIQQQQPGGEIFKAVPKLEQHYSIREDPRHPGPFPPNVIPRPTQIPEIEQSHFLPSSQPNTVESQQLSSNQNNHFTANTVESQQLSRNQNNHFTASTSQQRDSTSNQHSYQNPHQFFSQNLPIPQPQHLTSSPSQSIWVQPVFRGSNPNPSQTIYATPLSNSGEINPTSTTGRPVPSTTASPPSTTALSTTTSTTPSPKKEAKIQANIANLPDEVPDDIRQQLLSSGILGNADIQILDYDKVGDIPIENLPPEALANFYGAGGASAAASEPVPAILKRPKSSVAEKVLPKAAARVEQATLRPGGVEMKVVHFDPNTAQGQAIADQHIRDDATHLDPVTVGTKDSSAYNRYLPLKVSGASFPIPDVPELNGRKISSVVVLAPVDYNFHGDKERKDSRHGRKLDDVQAVRFLAGDALKQLVKKPSVENYKKWLDQESRTEPQKQSVVLLVTTPTDDIKGGKEIFMYDVSSQAVSKLSGDLSTAFVDVAESNSDSQESIQDAPPT